MNNLFSILLAAGFVIGMIGAYSFIALAVVGIILMLGAAVLRFLFYRCPHCGQYLDRSTGEFCPYCGKRIDS